MCDVRIHGERGGIEARKTSKNWTQFKVGRWRGLTILGVLGAEIDIMSDIHYKTKEESSQSFMKIDEGRKLFFAN